MSDFKTRLLEEKEQLDDKISKLSPFINSDKLSGIDKIQQDLLKLQLPTMQIYSEILQQRINNLN